MAGVAGRSGARPLPLATHLARNTYRPDRHGPLPDDAARSTSASPQRIRGALRRHALQGLAPDARRIAVQLLDAYGDWDASGIVTLRAYALSCSRLAALQAAADVNVHHVHREARLNLQLLKALDLEPRGRE